MKTATLTFLILTTVACGSAAKDVQGLNPDSLSTADVQQGQSTSQATQQTTTPQTQATGTPTQAANNDNVAIAPTPTQTPTGGNVATPVESNAIVANANDGNPNHLNVNPNTGLLDYRYGAFSVIGGGLYQGNWDGCEVLAGTNIADPNQAGHYEIRTFLYDPNTMVIDNGAVTSSTVDLSATLTVTLYPDRTGFAMWERAATANSPACYSLVRNLAVYALPQTQN